MKDQVPADRRLLGTTWVFKVKKNGIFKQGWWHKILRRYQI